MKEIYLGRGMSALVDDCDFDTLSKFKWGLLKHRTGKFYALGKVNGKPILMHRFILSVDSFCIKVDHANGNPLDNQRSNLRVCSNSQNMMNRGIASHNKSGYKGVIKRITKRGILWKAQISANGKVVYIGQYKTQKEAALAYNQMAKELHGDFAYLNKLE